MTFNDTQRLLNALMRTIDRKAILVVDTTGGEVGDKVTVRVSQGRRSSSMLVATDDILASETDLIRRNRLRTALKQAYDRMWHAEGEFFSTKMPEHKVESGANDWGRGYQRRGGPPRR